MNTDNIKVHLSRLHRHYHSCVKSYDYLAMLDLAVALYNVTELLDDINQITDKVFTVTDPHIKLTRLFKNFDHIYFELPNPITTYTTGFKGEMREAIFFPEYLVGEGIESTIRAKITQGKKLNEIEFNLFFYIHKELSKEEGDIFNRFQNKSNTRKLRFMQYMNHKFFWYRLDAHKYHAISRKDLIETVANDQNARHPIKEGRLKKFRYTDPVMKFMDFKLAGLPIPFFALLHIANDILSNDTLSELIVPKGTE